MMHTYNEGYQHFFEGLKTLEASLYPKKCNCCGKIFHTPKEFLIDTQSITKNIKYSGLKMSYDDNGSTIIEAYRNCPCGSTLLSNFGDRRDMSEAGNKRRAQFEELLNFLTGQGLDRELARGELLTILRQSNGSISLSSNHNMFDSTPINNISVYLTAY
jgi:hypothetical protein